MMLSKKKKAAKLQDVEAPLPPVEEAVVAAEPAPAVEPQVSVDEILDLYKGRLFGPSKVRVLKSELRKHNGLSLIHLALADGTTMLLPEVELHAQLVK